MEKGGVNRTWPDVLATLETLRWSFAEIGSKRTGKPDRPKSEQLPILEALRIMSKFNRKFPGR